MRKAAFAESRILLILADRFGFTGTGGGGTGVSSDLREVCKALREAMASWMALSLEEEDMAFVAGSMLSGICSKNSRESSVAMLMLSDVISI